MPANKVTWLAFNQFSHFMRVFGGIVERLPKDIKTAIDAIMTAKSFGVNVLGNINLFVKKYTTSSVKRKTIREINSAIFRTW